MRPTLDRAEAQRLVETYSDRLLRLAYSILNSVPDAQDVCQEVLLKRLEYPGAFENEKHEQAWMVRVTVWKRCSVCLPSTGRCWCSTTI